MLYTFVKMCNFNFSFAYLLVGAVMGICGDVLLGNF